jgi:hypothetical protein
MAADRVPNTFVDPTINAAIVSPPHNFEGLPVDGSD